MKKTVIKIGYGCLGALLSVAWPLSGQTAATKIELPNPIQSNDFQELLAKILEIFTQIMIPIITIVFIYAGYKFASAGGSKDKLGEAKTALINALLGAAIILGAFAISAILTSTAKKL